MKAIKTTKLQDVFRVILGLFMVFAAVGHMSFHRAEFQAQVPEWIPIGKDAVVLISGVVELILGLFMIFWTREKVKVGFALAIFYVLIFPGNIAQYVNKTDAFGLDTDQARLIRLFFQPVLILWAIWSTGGFLYWRSRRG